MRETLRIDRSKSLLHCVAKNAIAELKYVLFPQTKRFLRILMEFDWIGSGKAEGSMS
jgi:hypothetical protein